MVATAAHDWLNSWPYTAGSLLVDRLVDSHFIAQLDAANADEVAAFQQQQLDLLLAAVAQRPWWRHWLGGRKQAGLAELPIMQRSDFRASAAGPAPLVPAWHGAVYGFATSGSSGIAAQFYTTEYANRLSVSHFWHDHVRQGRDFGRTLIWFNNRGNANASGQTVSHSSQPGDPFAGTFNTLIRSVNDFSMSEHSHWLAQQLALTTLAAPYYVAISPVILEAILSDVEAGSVVIAPGAIAQCMTFAATVTKELRRRTLTTLGASIRDRYSAEETGPMAFQCPQHDDYYHLATSQAIVEVVDDAGRTCPAGVLGRVLVTTLHNHASPVVRYDIGDDAAWRPACVCGHRGPVLTDLVGRRLALIRLPDGSRKLFVVVAKDFMGIAPVLEFRAVQTALFSVHLQVVAAEPLTASQSLNIVAQLKRLISEQIEFTVEQVAQIDWPPGGKRLGVTSLVA